MWGFEGEVRIKDGTKVEEGVRECVDSRAIATEGEIMGGFSEGLWTNDEVF